MDAKNKLNQLRQARRYYPVVALTDTGKGHVPVVAKGSSQMPRGPVQGQKGKFSKGHGKKGKQANPKARAAAAMEKACLRCGR